MLPSNSVGQHRWLLLLRPGNSDESLKAFLTLFARFAALGDAGAFVARDSDVSNCSMRIRGQHFWADHSLEVLVDVAYCDPRYARVLRNVVCGMGQILDSPVLEFRVEGEIPSSTDIQIKAEVEPNEIHAGRFYPEVSSRLGTQVQFRKPPNYRSGRRLWVTANSALSVSLVERLTQLVDLWGSLLVVAFPSTEDELLDGETMILNVEGCQHDEVTFEVLIDRFIASEAAFYSLINLVVIGASLDAQVLEATVE